MKNAHVARYAAHLANLLWGADGDQTIEINAWQLRITLIRTLEQVRNDYLQHMVGVRLLGLDPEDQDDAYQAADTWFVAVMQRALELHGSRATQKAHDVFALITARGQGWPDTRLERTPSPPDGEPGDVVKGAFGRLEAACPDAAPSRITKAQGPLCMIAGDAAQQVPEGMSLWQAVSLGPQRLDPGKPDDRDPFFHAVIRALETANESWETLRRLGLSPRDWAGEVSINQAKSIGAFVNAARRIAEDQGAELTDTAVLIAAWDERPVPRYADLQDFTGSDLGKALLTGDAPGRSVSLDAVPEIAAEGEDDPGDRLASSDEVAEVIRIMVQDGTLTPLDRQVLAAAVSQQDVLDTDWGASEFRTREAAAEYTDKLHQKVLAGMDRLRRGAVAAIAT